MSEIFKGRGARLTNIDLPMVGRGIGVGEDVIHAILDVETGGAGYDKHGRLKMLFEPHVFYRELGEAKRRRAVQSGLAYPRWGEKPYPADSYPILYRAMALDEAAALKSASWGLPQIMGFNQKLAGYPDARTMIEAFAASEAQQLLGLVNFIVASGLDDDLRRIEALTRESTPDDWAPFARVYNGRGYADHGYHTKLAARFNWWRKRPDTPIPADLRWVA